jgi:hypothetical protein
MTSDMTSPMTMPELSTVLRIHEQAFLRKLLAEWPARRRAPGPAGYFCARFGIGSRSDDRSYVHYTESDFERAQAMMSAYDQTIGRAKVSPLLRRTAGAAAPKTMRPSYLAAVPLHMEFSAPRGCAFLTLTIEAALDLEFAALLVCEKLDSLKRLHQFGWLETILRGRPTLAVYGGSAQGPYCAATVTSVLAATDVPVLGLYDLDPNGLIRASKLPRLEALCLPSLEILESMLASYAPYDHLHRQIREARSTLDDIHTKTVADAWALVKTSNNGIATEYFPQSPAGD